MILLLLAVAILIFSGLAALLANRSPCWSTNLGVGGAVTAGTVGLIPGLNALLAGTADSLRLPWGVPFGSFYVELDPLSALFLLPILGLSALAAVYGGEYLQVYSGKKSLGPPWFFYNLLIASMIMVVVAHNGLLFLAAACFTKAFGIVFLGEPRSKQAREARESELTMLLPMVILAAGCVFIGLYATVAVQAVAPAIAIAAGLSSREIGAHLENADYSVAIIILVAVSFLTLVTVLVLFWRWLLADGQVAPF